MWNECDWQRVIFSDEGNFELFSSGKRVYVRRRPYEKYLDNCVVPTVNYGGGHIMAWGCVSYNGFAIVRRVEGNLKKDNT